MRVRFENRWRRLLPAGLAIVACWTGSPDPRAASDGPRAQVRTPFVRLGLIPVGGQAQARFEIANVGGGTLKILDAEAGCSCTVVDFDEAIAPGAVGYVRARLDTTELLGPVSKGVVVRTNDPERSQILLELKAHVRGSVALLPHRVVYMRRRQGEPPTARLLIRRQPHESGVLAIDEVTASAGWVTVDVERLDEPRPRGGGVPRGLAGDWLLEARFRDDEPVYGPRRADVSFDTALAGQPRVTVEIRSNLEPAPEP